MKPKIFFIFSYMFFFRQKYGWQMTSYSKSSDTQSLKTSTRKKILVVQITPFLEQRHPVGEIAFYGIKILELEL